MDTPSTDVVNDTAMWNSESQDSSDYLNDQLSMQAIGEPETNNYCSVATAAKLLGKSDRHIQRMLKEGQLNGHKIIGRRGPQWVVDRGALAESASTTTESTLTDQLIVFETKFEMILAELQMLKKKVEVIESDRVRLDKTEFVTNELRDEITCLKNKVVPADAPKVAAPIEANPNRELMAAMPAKESKPTWWSRVFAAKQTSSAATV